MSLRKTLETVISGQTLATEDMSAAIKLMMSGEADLMQAAGLLTALATRGETVEEVTGAARAMIEAADPFPAPGCRDAIDTCGTGGDGAGTFNISTASAFVVAACGAPVCKHGNRAVSSKSGSADLLVALGANIELSPEAMAKVFAQTGMSFLFAPAYHRAMRHVMPVRRGLGVRTLFNLLGPLSNPARVQYQLIGVFDPKWLCFAEVLRNLGTKRAMIVHGHDGLDELSLAGPTHVAELCEDGSLKRYEMTPQQVGLKPCGADDLRGGDAQENAQTLRRLFAGDVEHPISRAISYNAGVALMLMGKAPTPAEGVLLARDAIASGTALATLDAFVAATSGE